MVSTEQTERIDGAPQPEGVKAMTPERRMLSWFFWAQFIAGLVLGRWTGWPAVGTIALIWAAAWYYGRDRSESIGLLGIVPPQPGGVRAAALLLLPTVVWPRLIGLPFQVALPGVVVPRYPGLGMWLAVVTIAIIPLVEEILYRGVLLNALRPWGRAPAILAGAVLFGLGHGPALFVSTVVFGWVLGWLAWEYRSIWPGVLIHAGFNLFAGVGALASDMLPEAVGGPLLTVVFIVMMVGSAIIARRERDLLRRVFIEPWRETKVPPGLWRPLGSIFRLWPVAVQAGICIWAWAMMFADPTRITQ